jgi:hypothetical protein
MNRGEDGTTKNTKRRHPPDAPAREIDGTLAGWYVAFFRAGIIEA